MNKRANIMHNIEKLLLVLVNLLLFSLGFQSYSDGLCGWTLEQYRWNYICFFCCCWNSESDFGVSYFFLSLFLPSNLPFYVLFFFLLVVCDHKLHALLVANRFQFIALFLFSNLIVTHLTRKWCGIIIKKNYCKYDQYRGKMMR